MASDESSCRAAVSGELRGRCRVMTVVLVIVVVVVITVSCPGRVDDIAAASTALVDACRCSRRLGPFASSCQALRPALPLRYIVSQCIGQIGHVPRFTFVRRVVVSLGCEMLNVVRRCVKCEVSGPKKLIACTPDGLSCLPARSKSQGGHNNAVGKEWSNK